MALYFSISATVFYVLTSIFKKYFKVLTRTSILPNLVANSHDALAWPIRNMWHSWSLLAWGSRTLHSPSFLLVTSSSPSVSTAGQDSFVGPSPVSKPWVSHFRSFFLWTLTYHPPDCILSNSLEIDSTFNFFDLTSV